VTEQLKEIVTVVQVKCATADFHGDVIALAVDSQGHRIEWRCEDAAVGDRFVVTIEDA
jgi:hypothetical protein